MIHNPQILVIYEPGMFGTFICSLFMKQALWEGVKLDTTFPGDKQGINAHGSGYKDTLRNFHETSESIVLLKKKHNELVDFFKPLHEIKLGVHRLSSYNFIKMDFKKYFDNFVIVLVRPDRDRLDAYGERQDRSLPPDYHMQWWAKNFKKKDLNKVPKYFLEQMSIKEKQKYMKKYMDMLDNFVGIDRKNTIVFNPDNISDPTLLQQMTDKVCDSVGIEKFKVPFGEIKGFINKNKKYLK